MLYFFWLCVNVFVCAYVCIHVHAYHYVHVKIRGQPLGIGSLLLPCSPGEQTQFVRCNGWHL